MLRVGLAALLILSVAEATQPAEAEKKFMIIARTFSSDGQIAIPGQGTEGPANPYPMTIDVSGFAKYKQAVVTDVNLTLHGFNTGHHDDVDVMLARDTRRAVVMADAGSGWFPADLTITLDDQASQTLPEDDPLLFSDAYRPANFVGPDPFPAPAPQPNDNVALSTFNGLHPDGEWELFIHDETGADTGLLSDGWELEITAKVKKDKKHKK